MKIYSLMDEVGFRQLFRKGQRFESGFFRLLARKNSIGHSRFAFVTPRSLDKRSSVRNRLRRRAREWVRKNAVLDKPSDMAVIFKKEALAATKNQFYEELGKIFRRLVG